MKHFIDHIEKQLQQELPGPEAQYAMAHGSRRSAAIPPEHARQAAVLALFYPKGKDWNLIFLERVANEKDRHSGQISFPGGSYDQEDGTLDQTALREAEEEVGVPANQIELLGALSSLYIPVSNFQVQPYVGFVSYEPQFQPQQSEVHALLETPFSTFLQEENRQITNLKIHENLWLKEVPYFQVAGKVIWGATAMMMNELVTIAQRGK